MLDGFLNDLDSLFELRAIDISVSYNSDCIILETWVH